MNFTYLHLILVMILVTCNVTRPMPQTFYAFISQSIYSKQKKVSIKGAKVSEVCLQYSHYLNLQQENHKHFYY